MEKNWYYSADGQDKKGPVPESELKQLLVGGQIPATTLVWSEGMASWAPASTVTALQSQMAAPATAAVPVAAMVPAAGGAHVPQGLGSWMTFVGVMHIIGGVFACLSCIGLIYGIPMIIGGVGLLGAKNMLMALPTVDATMLPFLQKQHSAFKALGWSYILMIVFTLLIIVLEIMFFAVLATRIPALQHMSH